MEEVAPTLWSALASFYESYKVPINVLLILAAAVLANWLLRIVLRRTVNQIVHGVKKAKDVTDTSELSTVPHAAARAVQRTRTLGSVGRHIISWVIVIVAVVLALGQLGVNLTALIASAGVLAAALAFGAQNVVKDILNGIFMVFEDQLGVGDLVTIGAVTGTVEDVGIRITQVRAHDGTLWFIRNGEVLTLGNKSQGWGKAIIDVTVSASEDLDVVERTILETAGELMHSPQFARRVTGEPEVLGLESVSGNRATIRLTVRTRPEAQFSVQRELRALIKRSFETHGIRLADETSSKEAGNR